MPLKERLLAVRWACGTVFGVAGLAFLTLVGAIYLKADALWPIGWTVIASLLFLEVTFRLSLRLLLRWRDPTPEDRKRIRSLTFWGGAFGWILVIWTLTDGEATSPFFKERDR